MYICGLILFCTIFIYDFFLVWFSYVLCDWFSGIPTLGWWIFVLFGTLLCTTRNLGIGGVFFSDVFKSTAISSIVWRF